MNQKTSLFFRIEKTFIRIDFDSILYLEACKNYTRIVTNKKTHMVLASLSQVEKELPAADFCRVHRSFVVRLNAVSTFDYLTVMLGEAEIPLGFSFRSALVDRLPVFFNNTRLKNSFMSLRLREIMPPGEMNN
jgi:DNA-binding LytR/AlgR family response regulator